MASSLALPLNIALFFLVRLFGAFGCCGVEFRGRIGGWMGNKSLAANRNDSFSLDISFLGFSWS